MSQYVLDGGLLLELALRHGCPGTATLGRAACACRRIMDLVRVDDGLWQGACAPSDTRDVFECERLYALDVDDIKALPCSHIARCDNGILMASVPEAHAIRRAIHRHGGMSGLYLLKRTWSDKGEMHTGMGARQRTNTV